MELLTAIMNLDPAQLFVGGAAILVIFGGISGASGQGEEDDDFENASWNPASVNYNE